jgi:hypothetical protein
VGFLTAHPHTVTRGDVLQTVDEALRAASVRALFTPEEAHRLFRAVEYGIPDDELRGEVAIVVERAEEGYGSQMMLDRDRVLDPLLDIRLIVTAGAA